MIQEVIKSLQSDLIEVQKIIRKETSTCDSQLLQDILAHTFSVQGKLLRPILHLACCHLKETPDRSSFHRIAAGLEILHTASLIHDDIIDEGELRRGLETVHKKWGLAEATLLGDW
ncbi:polyprenyl synthetase family protein, partial [bacterium]|nr:polyprenyl synthetase family protein [bacterium]